MMLVPLEATLGCCLASAAAGFATAFLAGRRSRRAKVAATTTESSSNAATSRNEQDLELLISSLYELTSHVDSQVGQHSLRVSEITNTLEDPEAVESSLAVVAGKLLITANQKLQTDLEDAKQEIQRQRDIMSSCMLESRMDALTGLNNRRALDHELIKVFADRRRTGSTFSLLILDADHFKRVNDKYGHMVGDQLLKSLARCLTASLTESDFVARYGGEEFVAVLPQTSLDEACQAAERIRLLVEATPHHAGDIDLQVSISIGVKEVEGQETDAELLQHVDKALYAAKNAGRNCCFYHDGTTCQRYTGGPEGRAQSGVKSVAHGEHPRTSLSPAHQPVAEILTV